MKIFQIGFNKCGTKSLNDFFTQNGYKSVHWDDGKWDSYFIKNQSEGNLLCYGADDIIFWSDISFLQRQFQAFAEQYPKSKFIYNIRNLDDWLKSREAHYKIHPIPFSDGFGFTITNGIDRIDYWKSEWFYHKKVIEEYFVGEKADRLLVFDIDNDSSQKIIDFIPELNFKYTNLPHKNKR